ncbi:ankyrin repeat domain-containing protein [Wolbachia endosymbiont of Trichogramma pretiosum]|uniref:ankyrin repeat domain-containing protein n=1 Tax=Wolbachia endosymbiont of Trichogramma pretiosum TaxID=125593 RepID=UPI00083998EA|nr:ankyrin repeat domain-containing protein [Wolbachia endosymbiont of Trichogramma pretiosum]OCA06841.1 ankyrin repeat family protein [Wolbachia endosymbiont of Trichogramma pretiosum]
MVTVTEIENWRYGLRSAVIERDFQKAEEYIREGKRHTVSVVNYRDRNGNSPLSIAVSKKDLGMMRFLIDNGAVPDIEDLFHVTPMYYAVTMGTVEMIELLIDKGARISGYFSYAHKERTLVGWAIDKNSPEKVEVLLKHGASPDGKFDLLAYSQNSCLHAAVEKNHSRIVELLIEYHADVNVQNEQGQTPIYFAISSKRPKIIKLLYDNGANIDNVKNIRDGTPSDYVKLFYPGKTIKEIAAEEESINVNPDPAPSSAVRPSSSINSAFSWMRTSTTAALSSLFQSAPALLPAQQSVAHLTRSPIDFSQVDFNGTALLADVVIRKFTGRKYSRPLDDSLLTLEQIRERKVSAIERDIKMMIGEFEEFDQCPRSLLSNSTISKGVRHQRSLQIS